MDILLGHSRKNVLNGIDIISIDGIVAYYSNTAFLDVFRSPLWARQQFGFATQDKCVVNGGIASIECL